MVLSRASSLRGVFRRPGVRAAGARARINNWRPNGRRFYASGHASAKASSDLPWLIGSVAVTVPSAAWLWQQGPKKGEHGHGHEEHEDHEESEEKPDEDEPKEKSAEEGKEEDKDDDKEEDRSDDKGDGKEEGGDEEKKDDSKDSDKSEGSDSDEGESKDTPATTDDEGYELPGPGAPGQINKSPNKKPGEGQKGIRNPTETKGEKDAARHFSGARHPYLDDPEKSKKGEGMTETAKIHGTVQSGGQAR